MFNVCPSCGRYAVDKEIIRWFLEHASADISVLDTSCVPVTETAEAVLQWAASRWNHPHTERTGS